MNNTTPAAIYHHITRVQDELDTLKEMLCEQFGEVVQIHDVSVGRRLVSQKSFIDGDGMFAWSQEWNARLNRERDTALELVTPDSEHFIVMHAEA